MGYYFFGIGTLLLLWSAWFVARQLQILLFGVRTEGTIVGIDQQSRLSGNRRRQIYYHPIIEFETADGKPRTFTFGSGSTRTRPEIGRKVRVVYLADNHKTATLLSFMGMWAGPLALAVLGTGALFAGIQILNE